MKRKNAAATNEAQESGKTTRREKAFSRFFAILLILTLVLSMGFFTYKQYAIERDSAYASLRNSMYSLRSLITFEGSLGDAFIKLRDGETLMYAELAQPFFDYLGVSVETLEACKYNWEADDLYYFPDEGEIRINGEPVTITSPKDAFDCGIGMIHQHFKLVDVFTAAENVTLGAENSKLDIKAVTAHIKEICDKYGFIIDPAKKVYDMSVSEKQTVEIIKVLYRGADILILDEPTAVLTPQETDRLFNVMRNMKADGKAMIIITHKLHEVMDVSDRVAVLRKGQYIGDVATKDTNPDKLTEMMVGKKVDLNIDREDPKNGDVRLKIKDLVSTIKYGNNSGQVTK